MSGLTPHVPVASLGRGAPATRPGAAARRAQRRHTAATLGGAFGAMAVVTAALGTAGGHPAESAALVGAAAGLGVTALRASRHR